MLEQKWITTKVPMIKTKTMEYYLVLVIIAIIPICFLKNYKRKIVLTIVSTIQQITIKHSSLMVAILSVIVIL